MSFVLVAAGPVLAVGFIALWTLSVSMEEQISGKNLLLAQSLSGELERFLDESQTLLKHACALITGGYIRREEWDGYLATLIADYSSFDAVYLLDAEGMVSNLAPYDENLHGLDMSYQGYYGPTLEGDAPYWSETFISPQTGQPTLTLSIRMNQGMLVGHLNLADMGRIAGRVSAGESGYAVVSEDNGTIIAHPNKDYVLQRLNVGNLPFIRAGRAGHEGTHRYEFMGVEKIASVALVRQTGWLVGIVQPTKEAFAPVRRVRAVVLGGSLVAALLALTRVAISLRKALRPLSQLTEDSRRIAAGDYRYEPRPTSYVEIDNLASSFKAMVDAVKSREDELREHRDHLEEMVAKRTAQLEEANSLLEEKVLARTAALAEKNVMLRRSEERFRGITLSTSDWIWEVDAEGRFTFTAGRLTDLLGYSPDEIVGRSYLALVSEGDAENAADHLRRSSAAKNPLRDVERIIKGKDGRTMIVSINGVPIVDVDGNLLGYRGVARDITESKRSQEIMIQTEKMMSVGGLAAGMAHEIRNPLAGVIQSVQTLWNRLFKDMPKNLEAAEAAGISLDAMRDYMDRRGVGDLVGAATESAMRAAGIVEDMLSFSRKTESAFDRRDLAELLDRTIDIASKDYDLRKKYDFRHVEIVREYDADTPWVMCEAGKIQQVFLNILRNCAEAMNEAGVENPMLTVRVRPEGEMVRIEIEDNGPGMDESVRKRVFEPFFTTKGPREGTGLGLSVSYFIITDQHRGTIAAESQPGKGTKFIILLPLQSNA